MIESTLWQAAEPSTSESETMALLVEELAEGAKKWQGLSLSEMLEGYIPTLADGILRLALAFVLFWIGRRIITWLVRLCDRTFERQGMELTVRRFLRNVLTALGYLILLMILLQLVGIAVTSLAAVFASAGVAIGLAMQGSLANFAGGLLILLMKPFVIGDYIIQGDCEGTVREIGLVYTRLQTPDNRRVMIPNGKLADSSLINVTANPTRRLDITVGIGYSSDLRLAKELLQKLGEKDPARLQEQDVQVFVSELSDSSVDLGLRLWVTSEDYWAAKWRLTEEIKLAFDEAGVEIPFRQVDVHMR
ncbi:MAG: mechanosensitive ion channel family protein [Lachnospiraceae bacterium]|nr:mechanosensitive ion channel family protein [Lachnospiraceae bacterium]